MMSRWKNENYNHEKPISSISPKKRSKSTRTNKLKLTTNDYKSLKRRLENDDNDGDRIDLKEEKDDNKNPNEPETTKNLLVSKVKMNELKKWLISYFDANDDEMINSPFLLVNGPSGSGKTITLKLLANELKIEIIELPITKLFDSCNSVFINDDHDSNPCYEDNQLNKFREFLNKFNNFREFFVSDNTKRNHNRKLLLIEEIPIIFSIKPELLHEELKSYFLKLKRSKFIAPVVFIMSTTSQSEQKILPKSTLASLNFKTITFKPISDNCLTKFLDQLSIDNQLNRLQIQDIISQSSGDIRHASNYFKFKYIGHLKDDRRKKKSRNSMIKIPQQNDQIICDRNESLTFSHAIAKILYAKRLDFCDEHIEEYLRKHPNCDSNRLRNPLKESHPEEIFELLNISYDQLIDWLFENYQDFIYDSNDLHKCFNCLQSLCSSSFGSIDNYSDRELFKQTQTSIAIRGMLFNLNDDNYAYKNYFNINQQIKNGRVNIKNQFRPLNPPKINKYHSNKIEINELRKIIQINNERKLITDILPIMQYYHEYFTTTSSSTMIDINGQPCVDNNVEIEDDSD